MRIFLTTALLGLLGYCAYGMLSTLEPLDGGKQMRWQIAYGSLAAMVVAFLVRLWWPRGPRPVERRESEANEGPRVLRAAYGLVAFGFGIPILFVWPFAWILRDGLGPDATESYGIEAGIRAFWTFYAGPLTLGVTAVSLVLRRRLAKDFVGRKPRRS